jgi:hypothetical protein
MLNLEGLLSIRGIKRSLKLFALPVVRVESNIIFVLKAEKIVSYLFSLMQSKLDFVKAEALPKETIEVIFDIDHLRV